MVAAATMYQSTGELRTQLTCRMAQAATNLGYQVVLSDRSPESVREALRWSGATLIEGVDGLGPQYRNAMTRALELAGPDGIVVLVTAEKYPLFTPKNLIAQTVAPLLSGEAVLSVPRRRSLDSYPKVQARTEMLMAKIAVNAGFVFDPAFFVYAFRQGAVANLFTGNEEPSYGVCWMPTFLALTNHLPVASPAVDYRHPAEQTEAEEGDPDMVAKRWGQLETFVNLLDQHRTLVASH